MPISSKLGVAVAGAVLGAVALATPAFATVDPSNCTYSFTNSTWGDHLPYKVAATCYNSTNSGWHAYAVCESATGVDNTVNGYEVYGSGTSIAQCSIRASIVDYGIVNG